MDARFVEAFEYFRDFARNGVTPASHADIVDAKRDYVPLSNAQAALQTTAKSRAKHVDKWKALVRAPDKQREFEARQRRVGFYDYVIAHMGGSSSIKAVAGGWEPPVWEIPAPRNMPFVQEVDREAARKIKMCEDRKDQLLALGRMVYRKYEPDMFEVTELFGSVSAYWEAVNDV